MKALVLEEYGKVVIKDVPKPQVSGNRVLIKIEACSICGSDVHGFDGSSGRRQPPLIMGHEAAGVIEEIGRQATGFVPGDRVTFDSSEYCGKCSFCAKGKSNLCTTGKVFGVSCDTYHKDGAMAQYITVPDYSVYKIPDEVSFVEAAMAEPLSVALHAINLTDIKLGDTAIIFGAGTIGSMLLKLMKISNCASVIMVDIDDLKLDLAKKTGADICINSAKEDVVERVMQITNFQGADVAFEAVGITQTVTAGIESLKKCGILTLLGNVSRMIDFPLQKTVVKELSIVASCAVTTEYERSLKLIGMGKIDVKDIVSQIVPIERGQEMFDRLHDGEKGLIKVVLTL
ncbi:MAG: galactitol-1-phosphate 5-dehydrogenase [Clostridia bacterium]|jgi:L-iditol 2-dehydrogenase|nr:galactitol-1-phosphate 5-dehydrogenase [Clostridia bacterium]